MATHAISKLVGISRSFAIHRLSLPRYYSLYTPDYLETGKSKIPLHCLLNIQIKSYAYPVLENYQKYINVLANNMDIEIEDSWAFPPKCYKIQKFKPKSSAVESDYELNEYQRNIQIRDLSSTQYPILLRALEASLPEGVTLRIEYFDPIFEKKRYVPDTDLLQLKVQLEDAAKR